jgi:hypothetical protein
MSRSDLDRVKEMSMAMAKGQWTAERLAKWLCEFLTMSEQDQEIALGALNHVRKKKPLPASILRLIQGDKP